MSFRKKVLEETGGFSSVFTHVADDAEFNKRLTDKGYKLKVDGSITVRHRCCRSFPQFKKMPKNLRQSESSKKVPEKNNANVTSHDCSSNTGFKNRIDTA